MEKAQVGIEYLILVGFITFIIAGVLITALVFSDKIKDKIAMNQAQNFAVQLLNSAESVYFSGEPSKTTIKLYLPANVEEINVTTEYLIMKIRLSTGTNIRGFRSKVPLNGSIQVGEGLKSITLEARADYVLIR